jgi:hypothetical protein
MKKRSSSNRSADGQSLVEFALILPIIMVIVLGIVEVSYALLDQHIVTKLTREGSNMISRNTTLEDAANVMKGMSSRPIDFTTNARLILSVIKKGATTGSTNYGKPVLYQRYEYGALSAQSFLATSGTGSFGTAPEFVANNSDSDAGLQVTNLPGTVVSLGGMIYVTEIYTKHTLLTPFDKFGIQVPSTLYSIAYF